LDSKDPKQTDRKSSCGISLLTTTKMHEFFIARKHDNETHSNPTMPGTFFDVRQEKFRVFLIYSSLLIILHSKRSILPPFPFEKDHLTPCPISGSLYFD
jgi:hypothetical protein